LAIQKKVKIIGIDASNLLDGGGRTHLTEIIHHFDELQHAEKIIIWGSIETLAKIKDMSWLDKRHSWFLEKNFILRFIWQKFFLSLSAKKENCDLLLVPGGSYIGNFKPIVVMCRNMLPFEWNEMRRYGFSWMLLRMIMLRFLQISSFKKAQGIIFLTDYAKNSVEKITGTLKGKVSVIPHGVNQRFNIGPRKQRNISDYSVNNQFRLIYVSIVDVYKHQWNIVRAVNLVRIKTGWPISLDLIGGKYAKAYDKLDLSIQECDPEGVWVNYYGKIPFEELHNFYKRSDLGIFASSCENMPNILLEMMSSGLPIVSSKMGPMKQILGMAGSYFDPTNIDEIAETIEASIASIQERSSKSESSYRLSQQYSWKKCAEDTFKFLKLNI